MSVPLKKALVLLLYSLYIIGPSENYSLSIASRDDSP